MDQSKKLPPESARVAEHLMQSVDQANAIRAARLQLSRKRSNAMGVFLGMLTIGIYFYTMRAVKQEDFLDDTVPPEIPKRL